MASNNIKTLSDFIKSGLPKAKIEQILLETGAPPNKFMKDPHFDFPPGEGGQFISPSVEGTDQSLKVTLTLSIEGIYKKKSKTSNKLLSSWLNKIDLMSMVRVTVYEIDAHANNQIQIILNKVGPIFASDFNKIWQVDHDASMTLFGGDSPRVTSINVATELNKFDAAEGREKEKYLGTLADGTTTYNIPIRLEPYIYENKNPSHLGFFVRTSIDPEAVIDHLASSLGEVTITSDIQDTLSELAADPSSIGITSDIIFRNGVLSNNSYLLQRADNNEFWFGDYHAMYLSDGETLAHLMTGLTHGDSSIAAADRDVVLKPLLLPSMKIVDLRDDEEIEKVFLKDLYQLEDKYDVLNKAHRQPRITDSSIGLESKEAYTFSFMSRLNDGGAGYFIAFDKSKILFNNSLFKTIAKNIKDTVAWIQIQMAIDPASVASENATIRNIIKEVLDLSKIVEINVFRKRVSLNETGENKLGTRVEDQNSYINFVLDADIENSYEDAIPIQIARYSETDSSSNIKKISNLNFSNDEILEKSFLFLSFKDQSLVDKYKGQYQYYVELVMEDGIKKYLQQRLADLYRNREFINNYISFINSNLPRYYNDLTDQFNVSAIESDWIYVAGTGWMQGGATAWYTHEWEAALALQNIFMLFDFNASGMSTLANKLFLIASPQLGNYQGLLKCAKVYDTFIQKFQKISGIKKDILNFTQTTIVDDKIEIVFDTIKASEGSISSLNDASGVYSKSSSGMHDTITLSENIPHIVDLESFNKTGYEYIFSSAQSQSGTGLRELSSQQFENRAVGEIDKYFNRSSDKFSDADAYFAVSLYRTSYFTPLFTLLEDEELRTDYDTDGPLLPYQKKYNTYKNIILDIIKFYISKYNQKSAEGVEVLDQIRKLLTIASHYGVLFSNDIQKQLGYLNDAIAISNPDANMDDFVDSSEKDNTQQQSSPLSTTGLATPIDIDEGQDYYEDNVVPPTGDPMPQVGFDINLTDEMDSLLFGILNEIILENNKELTIYSLTEADVPSQSAMAQRASGIKSLFIDQSLAGQADLFKPALRNNGLQVEKDVFEESSLSLETFGWWWFNYSNLVEVKYLVNLDKLFNPVWARLTADIFTQVASAGKALVCKLDRIQDRLYGVYNNKFLELPLFNKYFIINPMVFVSPPTTIDDVEFTTPPMPPMGSGGKKETILGIPPDLFKQLVLSTPEDKIGGLDNPADPIIKFNIGAMGMPMESNSPGTPGTTWSPTTTGVGSVGTSGVSGVGTTGGTSGLGTPSAGSDGTSTGLPGTPDMGADGTDKDPDIGGNYF